jgi:hypothetical protein
LAEQAYAYVTLIPVAKGFQAGVAKELAGVEGLGDKTGEVAGLNFKDGFLKVLKVGLAAGVAAALGGAVVAKFTTDVINSASALSAEFEGVNQIFGTAAKSVQDFAKTASETVGITETAALQAAKGFGVFATAAGLTGQSAADFSTQLVQAAGDLASFNDVPVEETLAAIKSGLQGQGQPLSRFGILMNEATLKQKALEEGIISTTTEALTPQERVLAANALVLDQLGVAQGDFVNYQDTFGNKLKTVTSQLEEMGTAIGAELLPQAEDMLGVFKDSIIPIFQELADNVGPTLSAWMEGLTEILRSAGDPTTFLGSSVLTLKDSFNLLLEVLTPAQSEVENTMDVLGSLANLLSVLMDIIASFTAFVGTIGPAFEALRTGDFDTFFDWLGSDPIEWRRLNVTTTYRQIGFPPVDVTAIEDSFSRKARTGFDSVEPEKRRGGGGGKKDTAKQIRDIIDNTREAFKEARVKYNSQIKKLQEDFRKRQVDIAKAYEDSVASATERFNEQSARIAKRYDDQVTKANQRRDESLAKALKDHNLRISQIQADFAKRQADIIQQSMDRLRNAYKSAVQINVASIFDSKELAGSIEGTVEFMRDKLLASQKLLENAAKLNAMGFSQTFIEQVVGAGTELGNELANSIIGAKPETIAELKSLYGALEVQSESAMDSLAKKIYDEAGLATSELRNLYATAQTELAAALEAQNAAYQETIAEINAEFNRSIAEAQVARDEALQEAQNALDKAILDAKNKRDEALLRAEETLREALLKAAQNFENDITKIEKTFKGKIASMEGSVASLAGAIARLESQLSGAQASAASTARALAPKLTPFAEGGFVTGPTAALIGEAGPEVVIPLDRFESMMGMTSGKSLNYYAAPNQSIDSERDLFEAMRRAKVVASW